jgi:hypothetical protein
MGAWILLTLACCAALYLAISLNKPTLVVATAVALGLGILMLVLKIFVGQSGRRAIRRR